MSLKLNREEAFGLLGYFFLLDLSAQERENILIDIFSEDDEYESIVDFSDPIYNLKILEYLNSKNKGVTNTYIATLLSRQSQKEIEVVGGYEVLEPCPCCCYRTLEERGQYYVCRVCCWEDDGSDALERYSPSNRMTLNEAKKNFLKWGVINESFSGYINDAVFMYPRLV